MVVIYVPSNSRGTGQDTVSCKLSLDCVASLSQGSLIGENSKNYPTCSVWMVPGTYDVEA
jgi:hypothetical protein